MHFVSILVKYVCTLLRARVQLTACRVVTESKANWARMHEAVLRPLVRD